MAQLGKTVTPTSATHGWILGSGQRVAMLFTVPSGGGRFSAVTFWAAGHSSNSVPIYGVIWNASGAVLASGGAVTTTGGNSSNPGGDGNWHTSTFASEVFIAGGTQIYIGWQPANGLSVNWAYNGGDHSPNAVSDPGSGAPSSIAGATTESPNGAVAAYATYTPVSAPTVTGFTPSVGIAGTNVVITGSQFTLASSVKFNGTSASFTVDNDGQITASVPNGATTGTISVTNPDGTGTSSSSFIVGSFYGDDGTAFDGGVTIYGDTSAAWQAASAYADTGTAWVQIL